MNDIGGVLSSAAPVPRDHSREKVVRLDNAGMIGALERWWGGWGSGPGPADPAGWRARLTEDLIRMLVLSNLVVLVILLVTHRFHEIPRPVLIPIGVCITGMLALFLCRGPRARAITLVAGLALTAESLFALNGPSTAGFIALFTACVLTVLLLGPLAGAASVVFGGALILSGAAIENGLVPHLVEPPRLEGNPQIWFQLGLVWLACTTSVVLSVAWLTQRFTEALARTRTALAEAQRSHEARTESDHRRVDTENALIEAQRHETLGRMVGGVSHDFNNAMFVILGWNDLLSRGGATPEQSRQAHEAIATAARNASALAKRMVTMSREESGSGPTASLETVAREAVVLLERLLPENIRIESRIGAVPAIAMDAMRLQQLVFDLALAARDRMPDGGRILIEVTPDATPEGVRMTLLALHHEARRPETDLLDGPLSAPPAVVRAVLERVGGTLTQRRTRTGARVFEARFPALPSETVGDESSVRAPRDGRSLRVLLVEDDASVRQVMAMALRQHGHEVREAGDGDLAMQLLGEGGPGDDVLCVDAIIPGTPSAEVILRFRDLHPGSPVLVCSGHVASAALARLIRDERLPFLPKPFGPETLVRRIEQLVHGSTSARVEQQV